MPGGEFTGFARSCIENDASDESDVKRIDTNLR